MTRKDYIVLANAIREGILNTEAIYGEDGYGPCLEIISEIKATLKADNHKFDELKFDRACTKETGLSIK